MSSPSPSGSIAAQDEFTFKKDLGDDMRRLSGEGLRRSASDKPIYHEVNELVKVSFAFDFYCLGFSTTKES